MGGILSAAIGTIGLGLGYGIMHLYKTNNASKKNIRIVTTEKECRQIVELIKAYKFFLLVIYIYTGS